jgi:hypothetical protein
MRKNKSARFVFTVAMAFLAVMVGYQAFVREEPQRFVTPDSEAAKEIVVPAEMPPTTSTERDDSRVDRSSASVGPDGLRRELLEMLEAPRNHIFWLTIRDAGFQCDEVESSQPLGGDAMAWRARCGGALVYWVNVDDLGGISADPALYRDGVGPLAVPIEPAPEE